VKDSLAEVAHQRQDAEGQLHALAQQCDAAHAALERERAQHSQQLAEAQRAAQEAQARSGQLEVDVARLSQLEGADRELQDARGRLAAAEAECREAAQCRDGAATDLARAAEQVCDITPTMLRCVSCAVMRRRPLLLWRTAHAR
jgi:chromosome segregation ATPase